jgi:hypothetical protein
VIDLLLLATMFVVCGGIGLPLAYLLPDRYAWRPLIAPALGLAVLAVLAPVTYQWGLSPKAFFFGALAVAVMAISLYAGRAVRDMRGRHAWVIGLGWLVCTALLIAPRFVGGEQFTVFQGNPWDTFAYLESAISYARRSHDSILATNDAQLSHYPFLEIAKLQLSERPSIHLLYATFTRIAPDATYRLYYTFLVGWYAQFFLVAVFAVRALLPKASPFTWIGIAGVFPLGFWGQYVFDINAWSQIASAPLLLLLFVLLTHATIDTSWRVAGVAAVVVAGAIYLYPEGFIIYAAALYPTLGLFHLIRIIRARKFDVRAFVPFTSLAGMAAAFLYTPILHFLIKQVTWSSKARVPWWEFFQAFFKGRDNAWGTGFEQKADFTAGIFGMYFATGDNLQRSLVVFLVFALVAAAVVMAVRGQLPIRAWVVAAFVLVLPAVYLFHADNYWPAGKVLSYAAPILVITLAMTVGVVRWLAVAFIAFQLACGVIRIAAVRAPDGIHYASPYPAVSWAPTKREIAWNMRGLEPHLKRSMKVLVHPTHMWLEQRLIVMLFSRRIQYVKLGLANTYFGDGRTVPSPGVPWQPDVEIFVDKFTFVLHFTNSNRPDIRVDAR